MFLGGKAYFHGRTVGFREYRIAPFGKAEPCGFTGGYPLL